MYFDQHLDDAHFKRLLKSYFSKHFEQESGKRKKNEASWCVQINMTEFWLEYDRKILWEWPKRGHLLVLSLFPNIVDFFGGLLQAQLEKKA